LTMIDESGLVLDSWQAQVKACLEAGTRGDAARKAVEPLKAFAKGFRDAFDAFVQTAEKMQAAPPEPAPAGEKKASSLPKTSETAVTAVAPGSAAGNASAPVRSTVTVVAPSGSRVWINKVEIPGPRERVRSFLTPPLRAGQVYSYELEAEVARQGRMGTRTVFRAGQAVRVDFDQQIALR